MSKIAGKGIVAILAIMLFAAQAHAFWGFGKYESVSPEQGVVSIPVADVSDGDAHYYTMDNGQGDVNFFLLKSSDGVIRAAFDACDVCFREKKGYSRDGDFMVCNNCGMRFHSARINVISGGCNPAPLKRVNTGETIVIQAADIAAGQRFF